MSTPRFKKYKMETLFGRRNRINELGMDQANLQPAQGADDARRGHVQQAGGSDHEAARKDGRVSRDRGSAAAGSAEHDRRHTDRHESQIDRLTAKI